MATRKKYKIVLSEKYVSKSENGKEWFQFPVNISGQLVAIQTIIPLDPYTEPDMEQVRKEAYDKGYDDATAEIGSDEQAIAEKAYQKGLSDAWEAARKIVTWPDRSLINSDVFDLDPGESIFTKYSATKAIEKIRQYEQEKEEQIQVGDEVISPDGKGVVTEISDRIVRIMYSSGSGYIIKPEELTKTGRHFPEIAEVLQKMKES